MADETTTTSTTVDLTKGDPTSQAPNASSEQETTTTTTAPEVSTAEQNQSLHKPEASTVTESTTVTAGASVTSTGDDLASDVQSPTTNDNEQTLEEVQAQARATAMHNHAVEHADDPVTKSSDPTAV